MNADDTPNTAPSTPAAAKQAKAKGSKKAKPAKKGAKKAKAKKAANGDTPRGPEALKKYAPQYVRDDKHKTAAGNASVHCNDKVAQKLAGKDLEDVYKDAAKTTETTVAELKKKYGHLNLGMQRMNLGNRIRGVLNAK